jgi:ParB family chromosome partitioning protein
MKSIILLMAGGAIEQDLFDDENEGYLTDPALLDRLVRDRCEKLVSDLLAQGRAWAKPHLENNHGSAQDTEIYVRLRCDMGF